MEKMAIQLENNIKYLLKRNYEKSDYLMLEKFVNYILNNMDVRSNPVFRMYFCKKRIITICEEFLKTMGYYDYYCSIKNDIVIINNDEKNFNMPSYINTSGCYRIDGKKLIIIFLENNIKDIYKLAHEIIHHYNLPIKTDQTWYILTEVLSFECEHLLTDYLKSNYDCMVECLKYEEARNNSIYLLSSLCKFEISQLDNYLKYKRINIDDFKLNRKLYPKIISPNSFQNLNFVKSEQYIYATMFSRYMHQNTNIDTFKFINENLNQINFIDFLNIIGLGLANINICDLTETSYQKVFKAYDNKTKGVK